MARDQTRNEERGKRRLGERVRMGVGMRGDNGEGREVIVSFLSRHPAISETN